MQKWDERGKKRGEVECVHFRMKMDTFMDHVIICY